MRNPKVGDLVMYDESPAMVVYTRKVHRVHEYNGYILICFEDKKRGWNSLLTKNLVPDDSIMGMTGLLWARSSGLSVHEINDGYEVDA